MSGKAASRKQELLTSGKSGQEDSARTPPGDRRQGLRTSTVEGVFATIHGNLTGGIIFTSFMISLGAQKFHFALLNAISALAQLVQIFSAFWVSRISQRKLVVLITALLSRLILCMIVILPYLLPLPLALKVVLGAAFLWGALGSISGNAWTGWMSDLVPRRIRGRYFSSRNYALMLTTIISSLAASWFLDQFSGEPAGGLLSVLPNLRGRWIFAPEYKMGAFVFLYTLGAVPAIVCALLIHRQFEPSRHVRVEVLKYRFLKSVREPFRDRIFFRFLVFASLYSLVNSLAGPYWAPYYLEELHMTYFTLALCGLVATACGLVTTKFWGRLCDRYGNRPVILTTMFFSSFHPLLYLVSTRNFLLPIYIDFASSGIMWTGFGIAMSNFLLLTGQPRNKEMFYAVYGTSGAAVVFAGSLFSGYIINILPTIRMGPVNWNNVQVIFLITSALRLASLVLAGKLIYESGASSVLRMARRILKKSN